MGKVKKAVSKSRRAKRRYDSSRRQAQAEETRREIVDAARGLFMERGYAGTTIAAIARQAGVAAETVYAAFGNKRAILARVVGFLVVGDHERVPLGDRPGVLAIIQEHDQRKQIRMLARQMREIHERVGPVWRIMRAAEQEDPEIATLVQEGLKGRLGGMAQFVVGLHSNGPLREGVTMSAAAETVWAIGSPEVHRLLAVDRGWSAEKYEAWLADALVRSLLP
ncbi:MAG: TetR/AcrR family transcriptional regulator [Longimicrobiales bacterium]